MSENPASPPAPEPSTPAAASPPPQAGAYATTAPAPGTLAVPGEAAGAPTNTLALVSLIASIVGVIGILPIIGAVVGIITGHMGSRQIRDRGEQGEGLAKAGIIIGYVGLALWLIAGVIIFLALVVFAVASVETSTAN